MIVALCVSATQFNEVYIALVYKMLHNVSQELRTITTYVLVINLCCRRIFNYGWRESQQVETTCFIGGRWTTWTYRSVIHYIYFHHSAAVGLGGVHLDRLPAYNSTWYFQAAPHPWTNPAWHCVIRWNQGVMVSAALNFIFPAFTMEITGLVQFVGFLERNLQMFKTDRRHVSRSEALPKLGSEIDIYCYCTCTTELWEVDSSIFSNFNF